MPGEEMGGGDLSAESKAVKDSEGAARHGHATTSAFEIPSRDTANSLAT